MARRGTLWWIAEVTDRQFSSPYHKLLMFTMANFVDENDSCFPSQKRLAGALSVSERKVRRLLAEMEEAGFFVRERRTDPGTGYRTSDRYYLTRDAVLALPYCEECGPDVHEKDRDSLPAGMAARGGSYRPEGEGLPANEAEPNGAGRHEADEEQPKLEQPNSEPTTTRAQALEAMFVDLFKAWPRQTAKADARSEFARAAKRAGLDVVVTGVRRYLADPNLPPATYVPEMFRWLKKDKWEDGPLPPRLDRRQNDGTATKAMSDWSDGKTSWTKEELMGKREAQ